MFLSKIRKFNYTISSLLQLETQSTMLCSLRGACSQRLLSRVIPNWTVLPSEASCLSCPGELLLLGLLPCNTGTMKFLLSALSTLSWMNHLLTSLPSSHLPKMVMFLKQYHLSPGIHLLPPWSPLPPALP